MWEGILCDLCKSRIPIVRLDADIEVSCVKEGRQVAQILAVEFDACEVCLTNQDIRILKIKSREDYKAPDVIK
ncbi:MAG: hypothetical protein JSU72_15750 [Deltaproteobacteria bacterium]|nr:MAG: hypothetical protein JSU72_15750 [Deltaproteobacteria bacterium]